MQSEGPAQWYGMLTLPMVLVPLIGTGVCTSYSTFNPGPCLCQEQVVEDHLEDLEDSPSSCF